MTTDTPVIWTIDAEGSGWAACDNRGHDAEWREKKGAFDIMRLQTALSALSVETGTWKKPQVVYLECPTGGVTDRWKHKALRPTFIMAGAIAGLFADPFGQFRIYPEFVDYWTWHKALCKGVPFHTVRPGREKWEEHDLQTVAALALRGRHCPVNWSPHKCDAWGILTWAEDQWRAQQHGQPRARRKARQR